MGKRILITGASTGIGAEAAVLLAPGNEIIVHYFSSLESAEKTAKRVEEAGGKATLVQADLRTPEGCKTLSEAAGAGGAINVLVNNAGGLVKRVAAGDIDMDHIQDVFSLNAFSTILMVAGCLPYMDKAEDPCIVNITSIVIRHGAAGATMYAASKSAIDAYTRGLAKELAPRIRVNAIAPGVIDTPFHEKVSSPEMMKTWAEACPLKKNGTPYDLAHAIKFVVENAFIHGETLDVNGGMMMR
ncbi:MAG: SDR family oxidoreductase [Desulfobacterales bacterium]|nr:SDR family oxidoreductase [Desulfobacterales bacterium]